MPMLGIRLQVRGAVAGALPARSVRVQLGLVAPAVVRGIGGSCQLFLPRSHSSVHRICSHERRKGK